MGSLIDLEVAEQVWSEKFFQAIWYLQAWYKHVD
jgi:hypothetical protein